MRLQRILVGLLVAVALPAALVGCGSSSDSNASGQIIFSSTTGTASDIFIMRGDGSDLRLLVSNGSQPSLSQTGGQFVFVRGSDVFLGNTKTGSVTQVTNNASGAVVSNPVLNPSTSRILYTLTPAGGTVGDIHSIGVDSTNDQVLITGADMAAFNPSGTQIAFVSGRDVFLANTDGTNQVNLTNNGTGVTAAHPAFNVFGTLVAFDLTTATQSEIRIVNTNGIGNTLVVTNGSQPSFNPDNDRIAFVRTGDIFTTSFSGTDVTQLTFTGTNSHPNWSKRLD